MIRLAYAQLPRWNSPCLDLPGPRPAWPSPAGDDAIGASLWVGYTQQSHWQVYNSEASRPFRETNYEPEVMLAFHPDRRLLGFDWRLLDVSLVHQYNARA